MCPLCIHEKEVERNMHLHWCLYRAKCHLERLQLSSSLSRRYICETGGKFFSKVDLRDAYLQIPVEEESSKLLCINTHWGLFKFERLLFGIKVAPANFQQVMNTMPSGFDFAVAYLDYILMKSQSLGKHKEHVHKVFAKM